MGFTVTQKRMIPKLIDGMIWGQRSQGHKVQKHIKGDQMAAVSYALYRVPSL